MSAVCATRLISLVRRRRSSLRGDGRSSPRKTSASVGTCSSTFSTGIRARSSARTTCVSPSVLAIRTATESRRGPSTTSPNRSSARSSLRGVARLRPGRLRRSDVRSARFSCAGVSSATILPRSMIPTRSASDVRFLEVLRCEEDRHTVVVRELAHLFPQRRPALHVESRRRFVQEEDRRAVHEREREVEASLHAAGVTDGAPVGSFGQADALEQVVRRARPLPCGRCRAAPLACRRALVR